MNQHLKEIIKEICIEKNIEYEELSFGWIIKLKKEEKLFYIVGFKFPLNNQASGMIMDDKYATYEVLKSENIPVIEHQMLFNPSVRSNYVTNEEIKEIAISYWQRQENKKVVIKANQGTCGRQVFCCENESEIEQAIQGTFMKKDSVSICPFYEVKMEYRTIYLEGECMLIYGKQRKEGEWKHNLFHGATPFLVESKELREKITALVKKTAQRLGIRFASIDVIITQKEEMFVLEVNSGVMMERLIENLEEGPKIAKKIYQKAIESMFDRNAE